MDSYILNGWKWNEGRYDIQKGLRDLVDILNKVLALSHPPVISHRIILGQETVSLDNALKAKLNNYNLVKGSLTQMQRKKTYVWISFHEMTSLIHNQRGNLSVRSLTDVVSKDDFIQDSEYLETLLVAVPK